MDPYVAVKAFHLGSIPYQVKQGEVIFCTRDKVLLDNKEHLVPQIPLIIEKGWLIPQGAELPVVYVAPTPKVLKSPSDQLKAHVWNGGGWEGGKICSVCGVEDISEFVIHADRRRADGGSNYVYRDAHGKEFSSFIEMSCPTYMGDAGTAAMAAKEGVRGVKVRVGTVEGKVESIEERLSRLEVENAQLRDQLIGRQDLETLFHNFLQQQTPKQLESIQDFQDIIDVEPLPVLVPVREETAD